MHSTHSSIGLSQIRSENENSIFINTLSFTYNMYYVRMQLLCDNDLMVWVWVTHWDTVIRFLNATHPIDQFSIHPLSPSPSSNTPFWHISLFDKSDWRWLKALAGTKACFCFLFFSRCVSRSFVFLPMLWCSFFFIQRSRHWEMNRSLKSHITCDDRFKCKCG